MGHVAKLPRRELAINFVDFIKKLDFVLREFFQFNCMRNWKGTITMFFEAMVKLWHYRAMHPSLNFFIKQWLSEQGKRETLRIVRKLLNFHIRDNVATFFIAMRQEVVGNIKTSKHKHTSILIAAAIYGVI